MSVKLEVTWYTINLLLGQTKCPYLDYMSFTGGSMYQQGRYKRNTIQYSTELAYNYSTIRCITHYLLSNSIFGPTKVVWSHTHFIIISDQPLGSSRGVSLPLLNTRLNNCCKNLLHCFIDFHSFTRLLWEVLLHKQQTGEIPCTTKEEFVWGAWIESLLQEGEKLLQVVLNFGRLFILVI